MILQNKLFAYEINEIKLPQFIPILNNPIDQQEQSKALSIRDELRRLEVDQDEITKTEQIRDKLAKQQNEEENKNFIEEGFDGVISDKIQKERARIAEVQRKAEEERIRFEKLQQEEQMVIIREKERQERLQAREKQIESDALEREKAQASALQKAENEKKIQGDKFKRTILIISLCAGGFAIVLVLGFLSCLYIRKRQLTLKKAGPDDPKKQLAVGSGMQFDSEAIVQRKIDQSLEDQSKAIIDVHSCKSDGERDAEAKEKVVDLTSQALKLNSEIASYDPTNASVNATQHTYNAKPSTATIGGRGKAFQVSPLKKVTVQEPYQSPSNYVPPRTANQLPKRQMDAESFSAHKSNTPDKFQPTSTRKSGNHPISGSPTRPNYMVKQENGKRVTPKFSVIPKPKHLVSSKSKSPNRTAKSLNSPRSNGTQKIPNPNKITKKQKIGIPPVPIHKISSAESQPNDKSSERKQFVPRHNWRARTMRTKKETSKTKTSILANADIFPAVQAGLELRIDLNANSHRSIDRGSMERDRKGASMNKSLSRSPQSSMRELKGRNLNQTSAGDLMFKSGEFDIDYSIHRESHQDLNILFEDKGRVLMSIPNKNQQSLTHTHMHWNNYEEPDRPADVGNAFPDTVFNNSQLGKRKSGTFRSSKIGRFV